MKTAQRVRAFLLELFDFAGAMVALALLVYIMALCAPYLEKLQP